VSWDKEGIQGRRERRGGDGEWRRRERGNEGRRDKGRREGGKEGKEGKEGSKEGTEGRKAGINFLVPYLDRCRLTKAGK
jgi:hypothetical protein